AGIHDEEMHFSASLLKVAAMYSAYALRDEARALAASPPVGGFANATAFFTALSQKFKSTDALQSIQDAGVGLKPRYAEILTVTGFGGTLNVEFHTDFMKPLAEDHALYAAYKVIHKEEVDLHNIAEDKENPRTTTALFKASFMYLMIVR